MQKSIEVDKRSNTADAPCLFDAMILEHALGSIAGVQGARVVMDERDIQEVHVLASSQRSPKKIVRDIESLLMVRYDYRIDFRRISLAQVSSTDVQAEQIRLLRVGQVLKPEGVFVEVDLEKGLQRYRGCCMLQEDIVQTSAAATVDALNAVFLPYIPFELGSVQASMIGERRVVIAHLKYRLEDLLGTAFVHTCIAEATAHAVLNTARCKLSSVIGP